MAASVFDSPLFAQLFNTGDAGRLFSDSAAIRAMLLVEGALAKVQGNLGIIPEMSAAAIHRASLEIQVDPGAIAASTGENGVSVPGLLAQFRAEMQAPEFAQHVHWGATSQDIIDTALMLRLRQALKTRLRDELAGLFGQVDLLLMPVYPVTPFARGSNRLDPFEQKVADRYTTVANLAGAPALSFPTPQPHIPIGMQLIGPNFGEQLLLDVVARYAKVHPPAHPEGYSKEWR